MHCKIRTFGITRDILGEKVIDLDMAGSTVADLRRHLARSWPELDELRSLLIAVNQKYAEDPLVLNESDEIALIPPVSGG